MMLSCRLIICPFWCRHILFLKIHPLCLDVDKAGLDIPVSSLYIRPQKLGQQDCPALNKVSAVIASKDACMTAGSLLTPHCCTVSASCTLLYSPTVHKVVELRWREVQLWSYSIRVIDNIRSSNSRKFLKQISFCKIEINICVLSQYLPFYLWISSTFFLVLKLR